MSLPRDISDRSAQATTPRVEFTPPADAVRDRDGRGRGHRRSRDRDREGRTFQHRLDAAVVDVAVHRVVAYQDLVDQQFGGHPYSGRRGIDRLKRGGLIQERTMQGPKGGEFKVLVATQGGAKVAGRLAEKHDFGPRQKTSSGLGREKDAAHNVAIYRAVLEARQQLAAQGATARRVRLDTELRREVSRRSEAVRIHSGKAAADRERVKVAADFGLPIQADGSVAYPDAQLEWERPDDHPDGPGAGRVNIEVASEHYRGGHLQAKAAAGFAVFAANGKAGRAMSKAGIGGALGKAARSLGRPAVVAVVEAAVTAMPPVWSSDVAALESRRGPWGRHQRRRADPPPPSFRVPGPLQRADREAVLVARHTLLRGGAVHAHGPARRPGSPARAR